MTAISETPLAFCPTKIKIKGDILVVSHHCSPTYKVWWNNRSSEPHSLCAQHCQATYSDSHKLDSGRDIWFPAWMKCMLNSSSHNKSYRKEQVCDPIQAHRWLKFGFNNWPSLVSPCFWMQVSDFLMRVKSGRFPSIMKDMELVLSHCGSLILDPASICQVSLLYPVQALA